MKFELVMFIIELSVIVVSHHFNAQLIFDLVPSLLRYIDFNSLPRASVRVLKATASTERLISLEPLPNDQSNVNVVIPDFEFTLRKSRECQTYSPYCHNSIVFLPTDQLIDVKKRFQYTWIILLLNVARITNLSMFSNVVYSSYHMINICDNNPTQLVASQCCPSSFCGKGYKRLIRHASETE